MCWKNSYWGSTDKSGAYRMSASRAKTNLVLVSLAYLINMSASFSLEGLQSSLNANNGTQSLSALYSSVVISALFLPPLAIDYLKCRKTIALGTLAYAFYAIANCYPRPYTLIPAAVILGAGSSIHWSGTRVYVSNLAYLNATETKCSVGKTTSLFFGVFYAIFAMSMLVGNIFSSLVFQFASKTYGDIRQNETTQAPNVTMLHEVIPTTPEKRCGLHNCDQPRRETVSQGGVETSVDRLTLYVVFLVYVAMTVLAVLIVFFLTDEVPTDVRCHPLRLHDKLASQKDGEASRVTDDTGNILLVEEGQRDDPQNVSLARSKTEDKQWKTGLTKLTATGRFTLTNHTGQLLVPLTLYIGQLHAFAFGQFTRHWITCAWGIEYLGYVMSAFGVGSTTGGMLTGQLARVVTRQCIVICATLVQMGVIIGLLTWELVQNNTVWIYVTIAFTCGFTHAVHKTILMTVYLLFFPEDKGAASASLSLWEPLGIALAYAVSSALCNTTLIYVMMSLLGLGTTLYLVAECVFARRPIGGVLG